MEKRKPELPEFTPLGTRILILVDVADAKTKSGLILPATAQSQQIYEQNTGVIVSMGADAFTLENSDEKWGDTPKIGDRIYLAQHGGVDMKSEVNGKVYRLCNDYDVICKKTGE